MIVVVAPDARAGIGEARASVPAAQAVRADAVGAVVRVGDHAPPAVVRVAAITRGHAVDDLVCGAAAHVRQGAAERGSDPAPEADRAAALALHVVMKLLRGAYDDLVRIAQRLLDVHARARLRPGQESRAHHTT